MAVALAHIGDVADIWPGTLTEDQELRISNLIVKASAKLRQAAPWNIDTRIALFATTPADPMALDPIVVADVVATVVKRFLVNPEGVASSSTGVGPFSAAATYVNRYDKTGSDVRGAIQVIDSDLDQLKPAQTSAGVGSIRLGTGRGPWRLGAYGSQVANERHLARPDLETVLIARGLE